MTDPSGPATPDGGSATGGSDARPPDDGNRDRRWRVEADDEWLATHRSATFQRLRRLKRLAALSGAVSNAELGPYGGAPRRPQLKLGGKTYSVVRHVEHHISYTTISVDLERCRYCGRQLVERHQLVQVGPEGRRVRVGVVRACRRCQSSSWLFHSRMPATIRARRRDRKVVL
jgi:hypothetical protein